MKFPLETRKKQFNWDPYAVTVQTNLPPPKKAKRGMVQSSLAQASVAAMQNPEGSGGGDTKASIGYCPLPHYSISNRSASVVALDSNTEDVEVAQQFMMKWKTVLAVFVVVVFYLVGGSLAIQALEQPFESTQKDSITLEKASFLRRHGCVSPAELEDLIQHAIDAASAGVSPLGNASNNSSHWDLGSAFWFAGTVITTIGYGNIAPSTEGGKIFCILYAIFGIPLFGFLLAGIGDQLGNIFVKTIWRLENIIRQKPKTFGMDKIRVTSTILFILAGCILFVTIPAVIFKHIEGWTTLDAIYFVVITLTTVGIGDYVAGGDRKIEYNVWYKPLVWFWILVGLAYFAAVLSMIGDWLRVLSKKTKEEVVEIKAHAAEWKANVSAELRETGRRFSEEVHDKLQRTSIIRRMERRHLGLDQRAHSLDMLSAEKRAVLASLDTTGHFKTTSQESINTKLNNLRLRGATEPYGGKQQQASPSSSDDNIVNLRFDSLTKLGMCHRHRDFRNIPNIPEYVRQACGGGALGERRREEGEGEVYEEEEKKEANISLTNLPESVAEHTKLKGFVPAQVQERENDKMLEGRELQSQTSP